jgi:WD40 repeat protein
MDLPEADSISEIERNAADARGPFRFGQLRGSLSGRQAGGVGLKRRDSQALGRRHGSGAADAQGPFDSVRSVAVSADGKLVASGSSDETVRLWDGDTGTALQTLKVLKFSAPRARGLEHIMKVPPTCK